MEKRTLSRPRARLVLALAGLLLAGRAVVPSLADEAGAVDVGRLVVVDSGGSPIPGALVSLWDAASDADAPRLEVVTDSGGRAALVVPAGSDGRLLVTASGFLPEITAWQPGRVQPETVVLDRGSSIRLALIDIETERPLPSADVFVAAGERPREALDDPLRRHALFSPHRVTTGEDGTALLSGLEAGPSEILVMARGYAPEPARVVAGSEDVVRIDLDPRGCVEREVVDAASGEPVAGARAVPAHLVGSSGSAPAFGVFQSDPDGVLTLCPLADRPVPLVLISRRHAPVGLLAPGRGEGSPPADTGPIALPRPAALQVVVDRAGLGAEGLYVSWESRGVVRGARTDARGRVAFETVTPGDGVLLRVAASEEDRPIAERRVDIAPEETRRVVVFLDASVTLEVSSGGGAVSGADVGLFVPPAPGEPSWKWSLAASGRTDDVGRVDLALESTPDAAAIVAVRRERWVEYRSYGSLQRSDSGGVFALELDGTSLAGRVVAASDGHPLPGAIVTCQAGGGQRIDSLGEGPHTLPGSDRSLLLTRAGAAAVTDRSGRFALIAPPACGPLTASGPPVDMEREVPWSEARYLWEAGEGDESIEIALERGRAVEVTVASMIPTDPGEVEVVLRAAGDVDLGRLFPAYDEGVYRFTPPSDGPWVAVARAGNAALAISAPFESWPGVRERIEVTLVEGGFVEIDPEQVRALRRLVDARGVDWLPHTGRSAGSGAVRLGPLPPGTYRAVTGTDAQEVAVRHAGDVRRLALDER